MHILLSIMAMFVFFPASFPDSALIITLLSVSGLVPSSSRSSPSAVRPGLCGSHGGCTLELQREPTGGSGK